MKTKTLHDGVYRWFHVTGAPKDVASQVNRLFNFGVVPTIPDQFKPGEDSQVWLKSYATNVKRGFQAMAIAEMRNAPRPALSTMRSVKLVRAVIRAKVSSLMAEIPRITEKREKMNNHIPTGRATYISGDSDDPEEEIIITSEQRAREKAILAHWFGDTRDSASRRSGSVGE